MRRRRSRWIEASVGSVTPCGVGCAIGASWLAPRGACPAPVSGALAPLTLRRPPAGSGGLSSPVFVLHAVVAPTCAFGCPWARRVGLALGFGYRSLPSFGDGHGGCCRWVQVSA